MITVRYTKAQYMARITELEGYHGQLQQHLEKLEELREDETLGSYCLQNGDSLLLI